MSRYDTVVSGGRAILDPAQDRAPFGGVRPRGWPRLPMVHGRAVFRDGDVVAPASGEFLARPPGGRRQAATRA